MKILLVDDEPLARERLSRLLQTLAPESEILEASTGEEALVSVAREQPDLLLLDIRMPGIDGLEVAAQLQQQAHPPAIIFCTAYDQYALDALNRQAAAYLLKPVREEKLRAAMAQATRLNRMQLASQGYKPIGRSHITSETSLGVEMVAVTDVRCFIAEQKYVRVVHCGNSLLIDDTLKELEQEFAGVFLRVHRNALVAKAHVRRLRRDGEQGWCVVLADVAEEPAVSRRHLGDLKAQLQA